MAKRYGKIVYGYWDCNYCETTKLRGDIEKCPNCGASRNENTEFYLDDNKKEEVEKEKINKNPNWLCSYCSSQNEDHENICEYCGASKTDSEKNYIQLKQERLKAKLKAKYEDPDYQRPEPDLKKAEPEKTETKPTKKSIFDKLKNNNLSAKAKKILKTTAITAGAIFATAIIINIISWLMTPITHEMIVEDISWTRNINIETLTTYEESGWSLPSGARLQYSQEEIRSYKQVLDHYETKTREVSEQVLVGYEEYVAGYKDLGNGQFQEIIEERPVYETKYETETYQEPVYRDEPVYDTKYYYEIDRYVHSYTEKASEHNKNPYWPDVNLGVKDREGNRSEHYYLHGTDTLDPNNKHSRMFELDYSKWIKYNIGDSIRFTTTRFGNDIIEILE